MFIHDLIKIKYIGLGYLPNIPYHLISDKEMLEAFYPETFYPDIFRWGEFPTIVPAHQAEAEALFQKKPWLAAGGFFWNYYPPLVDLDNSNRSELPSRNFMRFRSDLRLRIEYYLKDATKYPIPDWMYTYMLGEVIGVKSDIQDIHDFITPLGVDNIDDVYTGDCAYACDKESQNWLKRTGQLLTTIRQSSVPGYEFTPAEQFLRYPTPYGEPHVIKSLRLKQAAPTV